MTPSQKLIDAAAEAYGAALVKDAANPYVPALEAAVTVAVKAALTEVEGEGMAYAGLREGVILARVAAAISSLIPAQEKTNET